MSTLVDQLLEGAQGLPSERAAVELLITYRDGHWLRDPHFQFSCVESEQGSTSINWEAAEAIARDHHQAPSDVAVLLTAIHLGGRDVPGMALGSWWPHVSFDALPLVLRAIAGVAGARAVVNDQRTVPSREA